MAEHASDSKRIDAHLAKRAWEGLFGHLIGLGLILSSTSLPQDHPAVTIVFSTIFGIQTIARLILLLLHRGPRARGYTWWRSVLVKSIFTQGLIWGALTAYSIGMYGFYHQNSLLIIIYFCAVTTTAIHPLVHDVRAIRIYLALAYAQPVGMLLFAAHFEIGPIASCVFYSLFLASQGARMNKEFLARIDDHRQLADQAHRDFLTGLHNRLHLEQIVEASLLAAHENGQSMALLYIDLDGFKTINDQYSHRMGDLFLCEVARRLVNLCAAGAIPARLGGDEFTVLLTQDPSAEDAAGIARTVLADLKRSFVLDGATFQSGASIGISLFPSDCRSASDLFRMADLAMYSAKRAGKNQFVFASRQKPAAHPAHESAAQLHDLDRLVREGSCLIIPLPQHVAQEVI